MESERVKCPFCGEEEFIFVGWVHSWGVSYDLIEWGCKCHEEGCNSRRRGQCCEVADLPLFREGGIGHYGTGCQRASNVGAD